MRVAFHAELRAAGTAKRIENEIGYAEKQGRPVKGETKVKGNDTGAR
jgi:hypothetical protein